MMSRKLAAPEKALCKAAWPDHIRDRPKPRQRHHICKLPISNGRRPAMLYSIGGISRHKTEGNAVPQRRVLPQSVGQRFW